MGRQSGRKRSVPTSETNKKRTPSKQVEGATKVHRCRFVEWIPSAVHKIAVSPNGGNYLAVLRANGDVELWSSLNSLSSEGHTQFPSSKYNNSDSVNGRTDKSVYKSNGKSEPQSLSLSLRSRGFHIRGVVRGQDDATISCLAWTRAGQLLVGTLQGQIGRVSVPQLRIADWTSSYGGAVWDLHTHPSDSYKVFAACEDGAVRVFRLRRTPRAGAAAVIFGASAGSSGGGGGSGAASARAAQAARSKAKGEDRRERERAGDEKGEENEREEEEEEGLSEDTPVGEAFFELERSLLAGSTRCVSLAAHCEGQALFAGYADGTIRRWSLAQQRSTLRMTVESYGGGGGTGGGGRRNGEDAPGAVVWSLRVLRDWTVVSGDSQGHLQLWDGRTGTQWQSFGSWSADVLALAVNEAETRIFASGVDNLVVMLESLDAAPAGDSEGVEDANYQHGHQQHQHQQQQLRSWVYSYSHRPHTHDVRALAVLPSSSSAGAGGELLVSGGVDTQICCFSVSEFGSHRPVKVSPFPQRSPASLAAAPGQPPLLLLQKERALELWRLGRSSGNAEDQLERTGTIAGNMEVADTAEAASLALEMRVNRDRSNVACSALAPSGAFLAVATAQRLRLYRVLAEGAEEGQEQPEKQEKEKTAKKEDKKEQQQQRGPRLSLRKCSLPERAAEGSATALVFSPDGSLLLAGMADGSVRAIHTASLKLVARLHRVGPQHPAESFSAGERKKKKSTNKDEGHHGRGEAPGSDSAGLGRAHARTALQTAASEMAVSSDGQWLAVCDLLSNVVIYNLDRMKFHGQLPCFDVHIAAMTFQASSAVLVLATIESDLHIFDVEMKKFTAWSRTNGPRVGQRLRHARVSKTQQLQMHKGAGGESKLLMVGQNAIAVVDLTAEELSAEGAAASKKQKRVVEGEQHAESCGDTGLKIIEKYRPILFAAPAHTNELVVVEMPWLKVVQHFPDVLYRHRYGT